jgi:tripartite-type tricarboxylate transporter receptor subunit TctC
VVRRLNAETIRIFKQPDIQKRRNQDAFEPKEFTPEQLTAYFEAELKRWRPIAQAAGMKK